MGTVGKGAETLQERRKAKYGRRLSSEFISPTQVGNLLGISNWMLTVWRRQGKGPQFIRLGPNTVRYPRAEFDAWLAALRPREGA